MRRIVRLAEEAGVRGDTPWPEEDKLQAIRQRMGRPGTTVAVGEAEERLKPRMISLLEAVQIEALKLIVRRFRLQIQEEADRAPLNLVMFASVDRESLYMDPANPNERLEQSVEPPLSSDPRARRKESGWDSGTCDVARAVRVWYKVTFSPLGSTARAVLAMAFVRRHRQLLKRPKF